MKKSLNDLIQFRLQRGDESMDEAEVLAEIGHWNGTVNRLYYAAFYAVSALLLKRNFYTKTHSGLRSKFNEEFIKKGEISADIGDTYNSLFDARVQSDYSDFIRFEELQARPMIEKTQKLINEIKKLI